VEQQIDLGLIGGRTFVNNASFGAYAEIVESPAYRDDKRGTTLQTLPDLLTGHRGARLTARAGDTTITGPQALMSNNPYQMTDIAGLGHRTRLDTGTLGVVAVTVTSAVRRGAGHWPGRDHPHRRRSRGGRRCAADPGRHRRGIGHDAHPSALRRSAAGAAGPGAPRNRPGFRPAKPALDWPTLRQLASFRSTVAGTQKPVGLTLVRWRIPDRAIAGPAAGPPLLLR
jgi:hypothetical protein